MIRRFETVPRNAERTYKSVITSFLRTGYKINRVQLHEPVVHETFLNVTGWTPELLDDQPQPIINVAYDTELKILIIYTI